MLVSRAGRQRAEPGNRTCSETAIYSKIAAENFIELLIRLVFSRKYTTPPRDDGNRASRWNDPFINTDADRAGTVVNNHDFLILLLLTC